MNNDIEYKLKKEDLNIRGLQIINFINLSEEEKRLVLSWRNSEEIRKWMINDQIISLDEHMSFIEKLKYDDTNFYWLVKNGNMYIGVIYLNDISWKDKSAFLGLYVNPSLISQGMGKILLGLIEKICFDVMGLEEIGVKVIEKNIRAIKLYSKSGFKETTRLKNYLFRETELTDLIIMKKLNERGCHENYKNIKH